MQRFITNPVHYLAIILLVISTHAQQTPQPSADKIKALRAGIQKMVENAPSTGDPDESAYFKTLADLRSQLQKLLLRRAGSLENRIQNLDTTEALPEIKSHVELLRKELEGVDAEINNLDQLLAGQRAASANAAINPNAESKKGPTNPIVDKERNAKVASIVSAAKNISSADLINGAATKEVIEEQSVASCTAAGEAQPKTGSSVSRYDGIVCALARDVSIDDRIKDGRIIYLKQDSRNLFSILAVKLLKVSGEESYVDLVSQAQEQRLDQQIGSTASSGGTTTLVSKGGIPYLFGLAVENGAATQSQSDTTVTFNVNPGGLVSAFRKSGFITSLRKNEDDYFLRFMNKSSLGFTFDTSRGNQPGIFTGDQQQLSAFSARFEFFNERDPRLPRYQKEWEDFAATEAIDFARQIWTTTIATLSFSTADGEDAVFVDPALQAWFQETNNKLGDLPADLSGVERINAAARILRDQADLIPVNLVSDQTRESITSFARQLKAYTDRKNQILDKIARGKIFTLEYLNKREINAPDTSNINFIFGAGTGARIDLTANGSLTFFHTRPQPISSTTPRPGRIRDFQFAGQMDIPFRLGEGQFDFWFSGRYERLLADATLETGIVMPNTKGDIAIGQIGLNIPIKSLGVKFPVSVTFANRTEFIKEKTIRGNFGFTFNWDTIWSKVKPF